MFVHPDIAADVVSLVGIAGANDGTSLCTPVVSRGTHMSCDEIDAGTPWLAELNGPDGSRETYGDTRWLTVYDGTGAGDVAFVGPAYAQSPALEGAENVEFPGVDHNGLRMREDIVAFYREWIEEADAAAAAPPPPTPVVDPSPPAEAGGDPDDGARPATGGTTAPSPAPTAGAATGAPSVATASTPAASVPTGTTLPSTGGGVAAAALILAGLVARRRR